MKYKIGPLKATKFNNSNGVYQDGTLPFCRADDGYLYTLLGHTNLGGITLWRGRSFNDMRKVKEIDYNFEMGQAGEAFDGKPYPDGPLSRGGIWVQGLWFDSESKVMVAFIHNETGWEAEESNYTVYGYQEGEPDYRHIGRMYSTDYGQTWTFDDWIITSSNPSWSEYFGPEEYTNGQNGPVICLGAGDFSLFVNPNDDYMYIFYTMIDVNIPNKSYHDRIYVARALKVSKGEKGAWEKYHNGEFSTDGNLGKESHILDGGCIPSVTFNRFLNKYVMSTYHRRSWINGEGACQIAFSSDLVNWSKPKLVDRNNKEINLPYFTICNNNVDDDLFVTGRELSFYCEDNGKDVYQVNLVFDESTS